MLHREQRKHFLTFLSRNTPSSCVLRARRSFLGGMITRGLPARAQMHSEWIQPVATFNGSNSSMRGVPVTMKPTSVEDSATTRVHSSISSEQLRTSYSGLLRLSSQIPELSRFVADHDIPRRHSLDISITCQSVPNDGLRQLRVIVQSMDLTCLRRCDN